MKYTPIFIPVLLILALIAVRLYRPSPISNVGAAPKAAITCEASSGCRQEYDDVLASDSA
jgi:hypothetical protein